MTRSAVTVMRPLKLALAILMLASLPAMAQRAKPGRPKPAPPPTQPGPTLECVNSRVKHNLFLMFLNAPARQNDPDWTLQNTVSMEFDTCVACTIAANQIADSIYNTPTINLAGWCLPKGPEPVVAAQEPQGTPQATPQMTPQPDLRSPPRPAPALRFNKP